MPPVGHSPILLAAVGSLWAAGYAATVLMVICVLWRVEALSSRGVLIILLVVGTLGTSVSAVGAARLVRPDAPSLPLFEGDPGLLHFAAFFNVVLYAIVFFWLVNRGLGDLAFRVNEAFENMRPVRKALSFEQRGEYRRAISLFQQHIEFNPEDSDAIRHYANCLSRVGRFTDAVSALRSVSRHAKGLKALSAEVEVVYILERLLGEKSAAGKEVERLREAYAGTPFEREFDARLRSMRERAC